MRKWSSSLKAFPYERQVSNLLLISADTFHYLLTFTVKNLNCCRYVLLHLKYFDGHYLWHPSYKSFYNLETWVITITKVIDTHTTAMGLCPALWPCKRMIKESKLPMCRLSAVGSKPQYMDWELASRFISSGSLETKRTRVRFLLVQILGNGQGWSVNYNKIKTINKC